MPTKYFVFGKHIFWKTDVNFFRLSGFLLLTKHCQKKLFQLNYIIMNHGVILGIQIFPYKPKILSPTIQHFNKCIVECSGVILFYAPVEIHLQWDSQLRDVEETRVPK